MSGHSHWHNIREKKGKEDARRSKIFGKLSKLISIAARDGGDPEENFKLRQAIEKAKDADMPSDTVERAIDRGTGDLEGMEYQEITLEAYGPEKTAFIIEGITDNRNRTVAETKQILNKNGGKMAEPGSVTYLFQRTGLIEVKKQEDKESLELAAIEAGADDIEWSEDILEIYVPIESIKQTKEKLEEQGFKVESAQPGWKPKNEISIQSEEKIKKLFLELDDHDDIQDIYTNIDK